jgi:hypothetical protein
MDNAAEARKDRAIKFLVEELKRTTILAKAQKAALEVMCSQTGRRWRHLVATFEPRATQEIAPTFGHMLRDTLSKEPSPPLQDQAWEQVIQNLIDTAF